MLVVALLFLGLMACLFPIVGKPRKALPVYCVPLLLVLTGLSGFLLPDPPANQLVDSLPVVSQSSDSDVFWTESANEQRWTIGPSGRYTIWYQATDNSTKIRQVSISQLTIVQNDSLGQPRLEKYTCSWNWQRLYQRTCDDRYILYLP